MITYVYELCRVILNKVEHLVFVLYIAFSALNLCIIMADRDLLDILKGFELYLSMWHSWNYLS